MATAYSLLSRFRFICSPASRAFSNRAFSIRSSSIPLLRPFVSAREGLRIMIDCRSATGRCYSTRSTTSSIQDPSPNWSNRPPKETILLDGCDFEHWLVVVEKPDEKLTRDEIIDSYIKTLAQVVGSEEEARMKIYSVSTKHYFAFGALVSEELSYKIKALPGVRWVLPDSYLNVREKDYGGEPFIDGQAVPYDPKYHEEWVRNNNRANERSRRQDRPRNFDRSRNFERRRENMQAREYQTREAPPMPNFQNAASPAQPGQSVPPQNSAHEMPSNPSSFSNQGPNAQPGYGYQAGPPQSAQPGSHGYQPGPPGSQGFQPGPPGGSQGYQAGLPSGQGYQSGPPSNQGYQTGPPGGQGYQASPPGSQGFQANPPGGQTYHAGHHGGQGYQSGHHGGHGYQSGPPGGQTFQASQGYQPAPLRSQYSVGQSSSSTPYYGGNQASHGGSTGGPAYNQSGGSNGTYNQGGGGNGGFQGGQPGVSAYQGGNPTNAARDIPGQPGASAYQGGNPTNAARDIPGRDI